MSGAGKHAAIFVSEGVTANTGPGIMATLAAGHNGVSQCRMLARESTTPTLFQGKETVNQVKITEFVSRSFKFQKRSTFLEKFFI